jgi:hypothetical protein
MELVVHDAYEADSSITLENLFNELFNIQQYLLPTYSLKKSLS